MTIVDKQEELQQAIAKHDETLIKVRDEIKRLSDYALQLQVDLAAFNYTLKTLKELDNDNSQ